MNIAIVTTEPVADYGGLGRHTSELSKELISKNHNITFINIGKRHNGKQFINNFTIDRVINNLMPIPNDFNKYDVILAQGHWAGLYLYRLKRKFKIKVILTLHSFEADRPQRKKALGCFSYLLSKFLETQSINVSDHILVVSEYMKERLLHYYPEKYPKTTVIYNGVDKHFTNCTFQRKQSKKIVKIASLGRLEPEKGLDQLINELEYIAKQGIFFQCTFVGKNRKEYNYYINKVYNEIKKSKLLNKRISFHPFITNRKQLVDFMSQQDIIIMPSVYEPFGLVALEAMAIGIPIIARKVGGLVEFINNSVNGFIYETKEELFEYINQCIENEEFKQSIISNAKETAIYYSWKRVSLIVDSILRTTAYA